MYGFVVLPFLITFGIAVFLVIVLPPLSKKSKRHLSFCKLVLIVLVLFIPSCLGMMKIVDFFRYGTFTYTAPEEIGDRRIRQWMPPTATNIVVHRFSEGYFARFAIDKKALTEWLALICNEHQACEKVNNFQDRTMSSSCSDQGPFYYPNKTNELGWKYPEDGECYSVTLSSNGAGVSLVYSEALGLAYLEGAYW